MDLFNYLKNLDEEQIRQMIALKITELKYKSKINSKNFIGVDCGINPAYTILEKPEDDNKAMWFGFIPNDVKIVYSFTQNSNGYTTNNGGYYYMSDSIIYEFAIFAKNKEANNYLEFLDLIWEFLDKYFNNLRPPINTRSEMLSPLLRNDDWYFEPTIEHNIEIFKGRNNAMCSEFAAVAQNILSIYGYQSMFFVGSVKVEDTIGPHAFNIAIVENNPLLLDFMIPVSTYDLQGNEIGFSPYMGIIKDFSIEKLITTSKEKEPLSFPEYEFYLLNDKVQYHELDKKRHYALGNLKFFEENTNYEKKSKVL